MVRKVVLLCATAVLVLVAIAMAGGPSGGGFLWWGAREPIYIYGDDAFTYENGVIAGSGRADDPYVIEGWRIMPSRADYGIYVDHTTSHFVVRNCVIEQARSAAVSFNTVCHGRVENCQLTRNETAVLLVNANSNEVLGNLIAGNRYGVVMAADSRNNTISENGFMDNGLGGLDSERRNAWYKGTRGNFWDDHIGIDANDDGVLEVPYGRVPDRYPLGDPPKVEGFWSVCCPPSANLTGTLRVAKGAFVVDSATPITLSATDKGVGLSTIQFSVDGGAWRLYTGPFRLAGEDGVRQVSYYAVDCLGNKEAPQTLTFLLDNFPTQTGIEVGQPSVRTCSGLFLTSATPITLRVLGASPEEGVKTYWRLDGGAWTLYQGPFKVTGADGSRVIGYYSEDVFGNREAEKTLFVVKDDAAPTTEGAGGAPPVDLMSAPAPVPVPLAQPTPAAPTPAPTPEPAPQTPPTETSP